MKTDDGEPDVPSENPEVHSFADDPTWDYFQFSFDSLKSLHAAAYPGEEMLGASRRRIVISTAVMAFLSLEAAINRLFYDTFTSDNFRKPIRPEIPNAVVDFVRRSWGSAMSIRNKYLLLLPIVSTFQFDEDSVLFRALIEFITFRNRLVHPKMNTLNYAFRRTSTEEDSSLELLSMTVDGNQPQFPVTDFSTTFSGLRVADAEKSLEIAYRVLMTLEKELNRVFLLLEYQNENGQTQYVMGEEGIAKKLLELFQPHFGSLIQNS